MKIVLNSSLPRAGSSLLQNILAQNPKFYCSPTSGVLELLTAARRSFTECTEFKTQPKPLMVKGWLSFCRGAVLGWYSGVTDKPVIVDKSRGWLPFWPWVKQFLPDAKVICCIRDLRAVFASMEKLHRKNMFLHDYQANPVKLRMTTIEARVNEWASSPPLGIAIERLRDALLKGFDREVFFVCYERLMEFPDEVMKDLYSFLEEEPFQHQFESISQVVNENDSWHGIYGHHTIKPSISPVRNDWDVILGPTVASAILHNYQWFYERFYK